MTLPPCLDPNWRTISPTWDLERWYVEVIFHGVGPLRFADLLVLRSVTSPLVVQYPLRKRIWIDAAVCQRMGAMPHIRITKLGESDEPPHLI